MVITDKLKNKPTTLLLSLSVVNNDQNGFNKAILIKSNVEINSKFTYILKQIQPTELYKSLVTVTVHTAWYYKV